MLHACICQVDSKRRRGCWLHGARGVVKQALLNLGLSSFMHQNQIGPDEEQGSTQGPSLGSGRPNIPPAHCRPRQESEVLVLWHVLHRLGLGLSHMSASGSTV